MLMKIKKIIKIQKRVGYLIVTFSQNLALICWTVLREFVFWTDKTDDMPTPHLSSAYSQAELKMCTKTNVKSPGFSSRKSAVLMLSCVQSVWLTINIHVCRLIKNHRFGVSHSNEITVISLTPEYIQSAAAN